MPHHATNRAVFRGIVVARMFIDTTDRVNATRGE
jgi:hypothetical protein